MGPNQNLRGVVEPVLTLAGVELWDLEVSAGLVRILVDRPGGVDLDALDRIARRISGALDAHDEVAPRGRYHLEVGSPGVERVLRTPDQFRRFVGALVSVKTTEPIDGQRRFQGVLVDADDQGVALDVARPSRLAYHQIEKARTVLVWGPAPKPGSGAGRRVPRAARTQDARIMKDAAS
jgi:ribosome maturation factor RimP